MGKLLDKIHQTFNIPYSMNVRVVGSKQPKLTILFIHGIGVDNTLWNKYVDRLAKKPKIRVVAVDLIGFGKSAKPREQKFDLEMQAKSLYTTLVSNLIFINKNSPLLVVGHSLGSLVAIKFATLYPQLVSYQMLVSPPIYQTGKGSVKNLQEQALFELYKIVSQDKNWFDALRYAANNLLDHNYKEDDEFREVFQTTLKNAIMEQDSYADIMKLHIPSLIYYGAFDPLIVEPNLIDIAEKSPFVWAHKIVGVHDVNRIMFNKISQEINRLVNFYIKY
ncbi:MAG: alpha/beta fold hydrolase [Candidatus Nanosyncoccaceae bacterium]|jgi:pimeloyl-ACP methyl ester carboxylesterase